jgi:hypothetical protein
MARPIGTKNIQTPERMFELFNEYRIELKGNPINIAEQKKGNLIVPKDFTGHITDISLIDLPKERPLTLEGFSNWLFEKKIHSNVDVYFANTDGIYSDYLSVCARIRSIIRDDQIQGGMVGIYNPSITQRLNGLVDKQETNNNINMNISYEAMNED